MEKKFRRNKKQAAETRDAEIWASFVSFSSSYSTDDQCKEARRRSATSPIQDPAAVLFSVL